MNHWEENVDSYCRITFTGFLKKNRQKNKKKAESYSMSTILPIGLSEGENNL